jgi:predicted nucleic acid-binding protein
MSRSYIATHRACFKTVASRTISCWDVCYRNKPQLRDPNDEMVLEAAINGMATHLVTFNLRDFELPVQRHQKARDKRMGPRACTPSDFLKLLEKSP